MRGQFVHAHSGLGTAAVLLGRVLAGTVGPLQAKHLHECAYGRIHMTHLVHLTQSVNYHTLTRKNESVRMLMPFTAISRSYRAFDVSHFAMRHGPTCTCLHRHGDLLLPMVIRCGVEYTSIYPTHLFIISYYGRKFKSNPCAFRSLSDGFSTRWRTAHCAL